VIHRGFRFDIGGHRFFTKIAAVEAFWHELLGHEYLGTELSRSTTTALLRLPHQAGQCPCKIGPSRGGPHRRQLLKWHFRPHPAEDTFEEWVTNRFGQRLYEIFFKSYTRGVGIPAPRSAPNGRATHPGLSLLRAVLTAASLNRRQTIKADEQFHYPRLGPGQMWEACRDRVEEAGGRVLSATA